MGALDDIQGIKVLQIDGKTLNAETVQKNSNILRKQRKERGEEIWEEYFIWMLLMEMMKTVELRRMQR